MTKLWKILFFATWIVIIGIIVFLAFVLAAGTQTQNQQQTINQYISKGNGLSAYQVAVKNGFVGSETDWLISLNGLNGKDSVSKETTVQKETTVIEQVPVNGQSSYDLWLSVGNIGSVDDYLKSLKGADGKTVTTLIRYNETTGKFETKLSTDTFWKVVPVCGGLSGKVCN